MRRTTVIYISHTRYLDCNRKAEPLLLLTMGPGGPSGPGAPGSPCSPFKPISVIQDFHSRHTNKMNLSCFAFSWTLFFVLNIRLQNQDRTSVLTTGPGIPLSPSEPGFPGDPWGPTGPVFP